MTSSPPRRRARFGLVVALLLVAAAAYGMLQGNRWYGPLVLAMCLVAAAAASLLRLRYDVLLPEIVYGGIDAGLLTVIASVGGMTFGIVGAVVAAVLGDA